MFEEDLNINNGTNIFFGEIFANMCRLSTAKVQKLFLVHAEKIDFKEIIKKLLHQEETTQHLQHEINARDQKICNLEMENSKLKKIYSETTKNMQQKHSEQILELQERLKNSSEQRQQDNESNRIAIKNLQQKIDKLLEERSAIQTEKGQEQKRNEKLNEEISSLKGKIANLKEANDKCYNDLTVLKNVERKHEMHLQDFRKEINDLKEKLNNCEKDKAELMAELAAEKKISHTKRQALEIATDEISKANEIILKQSKELIKMKKILKWRTEVALQQEQTIKDNDTHIKQKNEQIVFLKQTVDSLRSAIPKELDSIRNSAAALEAKYSEHYIDKSIGAKFQADIFIHSKAIVISTIRKRTAGQG
uniref:SAS-6 C-terminal coiled coil domain-containing protein n=1 Tax=Stomoxys calcitrans TaxID=35570 RepID=A0A1I8PND9_STOCA